MIITKNLQDVVHDARLSQLLAAAVETERVEDSEELRILRDYLVHHGFADKVAMPLERPYAGPADEEDEE